MLHYHNVIMLWYIIFKALDWIYCMCVVSVYTSKGIGINKEKKYFYQTRNRKYNEL